MEGIYATRKPKGQYPQAALPTPRILHLPRRYGVRRNSAKVKTPLSSQKDQRVRLEVLFEQERSFDRRRSPPAIMVVNDAEATAEERRSDGSSSAEAEEAKWRFQAEMLRAECNLLRMEKEIAVKKMERRRERMEKTLRSAVHSLLFGKQKISEGKNVNKVLEQEISHLVEKLHELSKPPKMKDMEARDCRHNFDRQASVLRRRLEKFDEVSEEMCVKEIRGMAEASFFVQSSSPVDHDFLPKSIVNIDILRSNMEASSKGTLLERIEREYGSILLMPTTSDPEHIDLPDTLVRRLHKETKAHEEKKECSRHCKAVMRRIAEEVRAEAEQWSQMQEMLGQVKEEMEDLRASRDFWQDRALDSDSQIQNLRSSAQESRKRVLSSEAKVKSLQEEVCALRVELDRMRKDQSSEAEINSLPSETEKRVLICRLKEHRCSNNEDHQSKYEEVLSEGRRKTQTARSRVPLREIRNGSIATM